MVKRFLIALSACLLLLGVAAPAPAQTAAQRLAGFASRGALEEAEKHFAGRSDDADSVAAHGMVVFVRAVERFGQGLYRHGIRPHRSLRRLPFLRLPVPPNPSPQKLTYEDMRAIYARFLKDLANAEAILAKVPGGDIKLPVDIARLTLNFAGKGQPPQKVTLGQVFAQLTPGGARRATVPAKLEIAFDRADMIWLRGYCRLLSALTEFILAYDWRETYAATAHLVFAGAPDPTGTGQTNSMLFGQSSSSIADTIAFIHLIRWPLAEPERLNRVLEHLQAVIALSRENWKAILAEKDDDREWLPGPLQKNTAIPGMRVTQAQVDGWHKALDAFEDVLEGRLLIPHWRFQQGIDLNAVMTRPLRFDLVLWMTGQAALPYLRDGPVMSRQDWRQWQRIFGGRFLLFAAWFN